MRVLRPWPLLLERLQLRLAVLVVRICLGYLFNVILYLPASLRNGYAAAGTRTCHGTVRQSCLLKPSTGQIVLQRSGDSLLRRVRRGGYINMAVVIAVLLTSLSYVAYLRELRPA